MGEKIKISKLLKTKYAGDKRERPGKMDLPTGLTIKFTTPNGDL